MSTQSLPRRLFRENVILLLVAMLVIMPLLSPFTHGASDRALRNGVFQGIGVLLLAVLLARIEFRGGLARWLYLARTGVNAPLAVFLLWALVRALQAPDRAFAVGELLRLGSGALVYFAAALYLDTRTQLCLLIDSLLGMVILLSGYGLLFQGSEAVNGLKLSSIFPNAHHLSAVLAVLFPLLTGLALGLQEHRRRLGAIAAAILAAVGLLLTMERSAWIAVAVGLLVWLFLRNWSAPTPPPHWRATLVIALTGLLVVVGFLAVTDVDTLVANRAQDVTSAIHGQDQSFTWRVQKWRGAAAMAFRRPVWGWGPGQFVLHQLAFTHLGSPPAEVRTYGPSFDDMAYNEYLQTAAELGLPGLALYLLLLASFFSKGSRALRRLPEGLRRTILLGCMAGVAAQMVDAMANGSWRYPECSIFFWLVLGLGVAVIRMAYQPRPAPTPLTDEEALLVDLPTDEAGRPLAPPTDGTRTPVGRSRSSPSLGTRGRPHTVRGGRPSSSEPGVPIRGRGN